MVKHSTIAADGGISGMATGRAGLLVVLGAAVLAVGCVDRRFLVETNVPGAQIYRDGKPIGPSPTDGQWEYAGFYEFTAVAPGYEPLVKRVNFTPKWYEYPPLDFFAEILWPFRIEDRRLVQMKLQPLRPVDQAALVGAADALRARGQALPPTSVPREDRPPPSSIPVPPTDAGPILPVPAQNFPFVPPTSGPTPFPAGTPSRDAVPGVLPPAIPLPPGSN
jgi:hypothetical protein